MPKGTFWAKSMLNSNKIQLIALVIVKFCFPEGIRQSGAVSKSVEKSIK